MPKHRKVEEESSEDEELDENSELSEDESDQDSDGDNSEGSEDESEEESSEDENSLSKLRESVADIPFDVLQELNKNGYDGRNAGLSAAERAKARQQRIPKRVNKNRPMEISSKMPVSRDRDVVQMAKKERRDPRFEKLCGHLNEDLHRKSYSFLSEFREEELAKLKQLLKTEKDEKGKKRLQARITKMEQQRKDLTKAAKMREIKAARKKQERELVSKGKKPFYLKKSDERLLAAAKEYEDLKANGKLNDFMAKKRKRSAGKDHRYIPYSRRT